MEHSPNASIAVCELALLPHLPANVRFLCQAAVFALSADFDCLVILVAIERGDELIVPKGQTSLQSGDLITVFSRRGITPSLVKVFEAE